MERKKRIGDLNVRKLGQCKKLWREIHTNLSLRPKGCKVIKQVTGGRPFCETSTQPQPPAALRKLRLRFSFFSLNSFVAGSWLR